MKKLKSDARVTEVGDAGNRISEAFSKNAATHSDSFLSTLLADIQSATGDITQAVKRDEVNSELEEADAVRDAELRILGRLLKGYSTIPVPALRPHGEKLNAIFEKYGASIADAGYTEESNLIDAMLMDFSAPVLSPAIAALAGTSEALTNIRAAQDSFAGIRSSYDAAVATQKGSSTATTLRKPLLRLINQKLVPYLAALELAKPEIFGSFAGEVSQIIDTINAAIKIRKAKPVTSGQ